LFYCGEYLCKIISKSFDEWKNFGPDTKRHDKRLR
jgi:hypothetical protein